MSPLPPLRIFHPECEFASPALEWVHGESPKGNRVNRRSTDKPVTWNEIPFNPDATPEEKGKEFDAQIAENTESANQKRERGEYPYDLEQ